MFRITKKLAGLLRARQVGSIYYVDFLKAVSNDAAFVFPHAIHTFALHYFYCYRHELIGTGGNTPGKIGRDHYDGY